MRATESPGPGRLRASGMPIYIYSTNKYKRATFPREMSRPILVVVSGENAERAALFYAQTFPFQRRRTARVQGKRCGDARQVRRL